MKTLVIGASPNSMRYSNKAVRLLKTYGHEVVPVGIRKGVIDDLEILTEKVKEPDVHTVTMYVGPIKQADYYDYILSLKPERIIFNPGTENSELIQLAENNGIKTVQNCTLVMLNSGIF